MTFVDLHTHILPGIDDGAANLGETVEMLRIAHCGDTRTVVATPHVHHPEFDCGVAEVTELFERTRQDLERRSREEGFAFLREMTVLLGAEHYVSTEFLAALDSGAVVTLNQGRHLLVEFSSFTHHAMEAALLRIREAGYIPVVAHVERYFSTSADLERLAALRQTGCRTQINAESVVGSRGRAMRKTCQALLKQELVDVIASDGHRARSRTPYLKGAFELLRNQHRREQLSAWMAENPSSILAHGEV